MSDAVVLPVCRDRPVRSFMSLHFLFGHVLYKTDELSHLSESGPEHIGDLPMIFAICQLRERSLVQMVYLEYLSN